VPAGRLVPRLSQTRCRNDGATCAGSMRWWRTSSPTRHWRSKLVDVAMAPSARPTRTSGPTSRGADDDRSSRRLRCSSPGRTDLRPGWRRPLGPGLDSFSSGNVGSKTFSGPAGVKGGGFRKEHEVAKDAKDEEVLAPSHEVALAIVSVSAADNVSIGPPARSRGADSSVPTGASTTRGCLTAPVIVTRRVPGPAGVPRLRDHFAPNARALVPAHTIGKQRPGYDPAGPGDVPLHFIAHVKPPPRPRKGGPR
jgi:hypothetical protein